MPTRKRRYKAVYLPESGTVMALTQLAYDCDRLATEMPRNSVVGAIAQRAADLLLEALQIADADAAIDEPTDTEKQKYESGLLNLK
jgi:hypothetical protein